MAKAYWHGHQVYQIGDIVNGWAKISFYSDESPLTGTGCCWVSMDDITVEAE